MSEQPVCNNNCKFCNKKFPSLSTRCVHEREKHTYYNTIKSNCTFCLKEFFSAIFNQKLNKRYLKCEECRDFQLKLNTNDIINKSYIYSNKERYFANDGKISRVCGEYTCQNLFECTVHDQSLLIQCNGTKCNNYYIQNGSNQCERCRENNNKSKNKKRNDIKEFKEELGGKCVDCGFDELFYLEFDHVNRNDKTIQITRSSKTKWQQEKHKLELRCGRCHRIKTNNELKLLQNNDTKNAKCKKDKKEFVSNIKKLIGRCQNCNWSMENKEDMCCVLDFDHVYSIKYKQISKLYLVKKERIIEEIKKTRLLCRHCHELYTCLSRGGKALLIYYTQDQIEQFKAQLFDPILIKKAHDYLLNTIKQIFL